MKIFVIALFIFLFLILLFLFLMFKKNLKKAKNKKDYYSLARDYNESLGRKIKSLFIKGVIDEENINSLEEVLLKADIGPKITIELIEKIKELKIRDIDEAIQTLKRLIEVYLKETNVSLVENKLNVFLILGVNGVGKTTSIAKIANFYLKQGKKVLLAAADTFRAAAIEQLTKWAIKLDIPIIKQKQFSDPAGVVFDAIDSAKARQVDLLLIDTAGRLHTKSNLIDELKKIERVIEKKENILKKNLLVLDATTGQNAFSQVSAFNEAIGIDGLIITKLDSMAKAGIVINIQKTFFVPIYFIGTGEKLDDLYVFEKKKFIDNIFS